ncbi:hypothetical protein KGF57_005248 [Candida theae]|uniref:Uncharacterized protein n=1 Tax=Candida theae TaxID=1198502 RepID=A0AAD5FW86_9ASCO|nr:uncharacterized protein KGF57_005248 [Candida theae]KAI5948850.1 hypothetical protein KGF57_005248 [Candida theae]
MSLKGSTTTSQLLKGKTEPDRKLNKKNLTNLKDIESALYDLELKEDNEQRTRRKEDLLEREPKTEKPSQPKTRKKIVVKMKPGEKFWEAQDRAFKLAEQEMKDKEVSPEEVSPEVVEENSISTEHDKDLESAKARLETLLNFQDTGAERTRIIDNASDFEMPTQSIWLSPEERALNLKRQQRLARDDKREKDRQKRGERQVEMVIKSGKVVMVEKYVPVKEEVTKDELELMDEIKSSKTNQDKSGLVWDYDKDKIKWGKPVYFSNTNAQSESNKELQKDAKSRVQFESGKDTSELIATMI